MTVRQLGKRFDDDNDKNKYSADNDNSNDGVENDMVTMIMALLSPLMMVSEKTKMISRKGPVSNTFQLNFKLPATFITHIYV